VPLEQILCTIQSAQASIKDGHSHFCKPHSAFTLCLQTTESSACCRSHALL